MSGVPFNKLVPYPPNIMIPSRSVGDDIIFSRCVLANDSIVNDATLFVEDHREGRAEGIKRRKRGRSDPFHELGGGGAFNANNQQACKTMLNGQHKTYKLWTI